MARNFPDWIKAYLEFSGHGEAPTRLRFWTAVSVIAGALRRRVWIDQYYFQWHPNFYIVFVARPGIVNKTTTVGVGYKLLRQVPGIKFGPQSLTWQSFIAALGESKEKFFTPQGEQEMSAISIDVDEAGTFLDPDDRLLVDMLTSLWDSRWKPYDKWTKSSGNDNVVNPWVNIIACTTPGWIEESFPEYMISGGLSSRTIYIYGEKKERLVAYPVLHVPADIKATEDKLVADLKHIAALAGQFTLPKETTDWGTKWYEENYLKGNKHITRERFEAYLSRKQTMMHKLAMVLVVAQRDELVIWPEDLQTSLMMVEDAETDLVKVFANTGKHPSAVHASKVLEYVKARGVVSYADLFRFATSYFPDSRQLEAVLKSLITGNELIIERPQPGVALVKYIGGA